MFVIMTFCIMCLKMTAQAQTQKARALAGYKAALETNYFLDIYGGNQKYRADSFCLMDLDGDSVPELFIKACFQSGIKGYAVYTYKNGSVQRLGSIGGGESVTQVYFYKKARLLREDWTRWGLTIRNFQKRNGSKLEVFLGSTKSEDGSTEYHADGKQITKQKYDTLVKNAAGSEKAVNVEQLLKKNNEGNRKKYLSIKEKKPSIKLNKSSVTLALDGTVSVRLKAVLSGVKGKVTWSSSNRKAAVVNAYGKVTGKKAGSAVITARVGKYTTKCRITVKNKKTEILNEKAMAEYKKLLEEGTFDSTQGTGPAQGFYVLDLDGNGVNEIMICRGKVSYLYAYQKKKAVHLLVRGGWGGNTWKYYKKNHVLLFEQGGSGIYEKTYYAIKNGKAVEETQSSFDYSRNVHFYERNGKSTTKAWIEAYERKLSKETPVELMTDMGGPEKGFRKNTAANRKRFFG